MLKMVTMMPNKVMHVSNTVTVVDLLRHGETQGEDIFRGSIDVSLSDQGWTQMQKSVGDFSQWQFLVSSPLKRCADFATTLSTQFSIPLHIEDNLKEISFGQWEGQPPQAVWEQTPDALRAFWQDADRFPPPGGERLSHFQSRIIQGFYGVITKFRGQHGLIVCHGGVIRMLVAYVLSMPLQAAMRIQVPYACVTRLHIYHHESESDVMSLAFHNGQLS